MMVNEHGIADDDHGGTIDYDLMEAGVERGGLGRRRLLAGVVAGAAGLLLPRQAATAQTQGFIKIKRIRFDVDNRQWGNNVPLDFYTWNYPGGGWLRIGAMRLDEGKQKVYDSPPVDTKYEPYARINVGDPGRSIEVANKFLGFPILVSEDRTEEMSEGQVVVLGASGKDREIKVTRRKDSGDFKVFSVELNKRGVKGRGKNKKGKN